VDTWNFSEMLCDVSYMWSELITDNKPQCVQPDFDPNLLMSPTQSPWLVSCSLVERAWCCLTGPGSPMLKIMFLSQNRRNRRKALPKEEEEKLKLCFLIFPGVILLLIQGNVPHRWLLSCVDSSETGHTPIAICISIVVLT